MPELIGSKVVMAVGQIPFDREVEGGAMRTFGTLLPLVHEDGRAADPEEFPDNGDVWWMLSSRARAFAQPGRLVTARIEYSREMNVPGKAYYQAQKETVEPLRPKDFVEIIEVPDELVSEARGLLSGHSIVSVDHPPSDLVYVLWRGAAYGPLRAQSAEDPSKEGGYLVRFSTYSADGKVVAVPAELILRLRGGSTHRTQVTVSLDELPVGRTSKLHVCHYRFVDSEELNAIAQNSGQGMVLQSDRAVLKRLADRLFNRKRRQELMELFDELNRAVIGGGADATDDERQVLSSLQYAANLELAEAEELAKALVTSGLMEERIRGAIERMTQEHIEAKSALLQTKINARIGSLYADLEQLERKKEGIEEEIATETRERRRQMEIELQQERETFDSESRAVQERLENQRAALERQSRALKQNLAEVSRELSVNRDATVNQFLAIYPLLQELGLVSPRGRAGDFAGATEPVPPTVAEEAFPLPLFAQAGGPRREQPDVGEPQFFERFCDHVRASGFAHRRKDLLSFHLSVKCNDLTILGGLPGTGKSSLPRLYVEALLGDDYKEMADRYLHVNVSPSWFDMRDLLGHVNALDRRFQPAEAGLYQVLIVAQEEMAQRGPESGLYFVCLDEMNLAHVEHYFGGFIQALEQPPGKREIRCFAPEVVSRRTTFAPWPTLNLPKSVRFVGTVNFDETTKQLSQRLLDRACLICLRPELPVDSKDAGGAAPKGAPIDLRSYRAWMGSTSQLDERLAALLDQLREPLAALGCPLNPRRFNAMRRFIASAPSDLCTASEALDLQMAQRILPQVRGLFQSNAQAALADVTKILNERHDEFAESLRTLEDIRHREFPAPYLAED